jgi:hypothetical protein
MRCIATGVRDEELIALFTSATRRHRHYLLCEAHSGLRSGDRDRHAEVRT